jgi:hypothetical protein
MNETNVFKKCPSCFTSWATRNDFLRDGSLELNGYKADFQKLEYGLFFFTHKVADCFSTMALEAGDFLDLYTGTIYLESKTLTDECPRYCIDEKQLNRCEAKCECAFVREVLQIVKKSQEGLA